MSRNVDHVIDATRDPVIAIRIATAAIAREVLARIGLEIGIDETLVIAIDGAHLPRPGIGKHQIALVSPSRTLPSASTTCGTIPKNGFVAEPGFSSVAPGSGVIRMPPVSVCHHVSTIGQRLSPTTR
jgi:hypothetical protein